MAALALSRTSNNAAAKSPARNILQEVWFFILVVFYQIPSIPVYPPKRWLPSLKGVIPEIGHCAGPASRPPLLHQTAHPVIGRRPLHLPILDYRYLSGSGVAGLAATYRATASVRERTCIFS